MFVGSNDGTYCKKGRQFFCHVNYSCYRYAYLFGRNVLADIILGNHNYVAFLV